MSDDCTRTYPLDPKTAEDPCEDCGRDQRKHAITPFDNVTPMVPIHRCASCHELVEHDKRFEPESHGTTCRQPEIRMRRLEARVYFLEQLIAELAPAVTGNPNTIVLFQQGIHASTESPDTQRSISPEPQRRSVYLGAGYSLYPGDPGAPVDPSEQRPDASAAEPERQAPDGAEPAGDAGRDT